MNLIEQLEQEEIARLGKTIPEFAPGDTVIVNVNVVEGERKLTDPAFLIGATPIDSSDPLRFEKRMIDSWLRRELVTAAR